MTDRKWPDRKRCRKCRRTFAFVVILGMYCSPECAGIPEAPLDVKDRPRKCRVLRDGEWVPKSTYWTADEAAQPGYETYLCEPPDGCGVYHRATIRKDKEN